MHKGKQEREQTLQLGDKIENLCLGWTLMQSHVHRIKNYLGKSKLEKTLHISIRTQQCEVNG